MRAAVAQHDVAHLDAQGAVVVRHLHRLHRDQVDRCCCSAPCTSICVVAASVVLLGSNTSASSPLPKSGRITRSPGAVNSTCSIRSRMWSSRSVAAVRPTAVEVEREVEVHRAPQAALTRVCELRHFEGRAVGHRGRRAVGQHQRLAERADPGCRRGPGRDDARRRLGMSGQLVTQYGPICVTAALPPTSTRWLGSHRRRCPPACAHVTMAPS